LQRFATKDDRRSGAGLSTTQQFITGAVVVCDGGQSLAGSV
jgi:hypothetical protein